jgi:hypothetical protein
VLEMWIRFGKKNVPEDTSKAERGLGKKREMKRKKRSLQHLLFPGSTGVFSVVWS